MTIDKVDIQASLDVVEKAVQELLDKENDALMKTAVKSPVNSTSPSMTAPEHGIGLQSLQMTARSIGHGSMMETILLR